MIRPKPIHSGGRISPFRHDSLRVQVTLRQVRRRAVIHAGDTARAHDWHGGQPGRSTGARERAKRQWLRSRPPGLPALPATVRERLARAPHLRHLRSASVSARGGQPPGRPQPAASWRTRSSGAPGSQGTTRTTTSGARAPPQAPCVSAAPPDLDFKPNSASIPAPISRPFAGVQLYFRSGCCPTFRRLH